MSNDVPRYYNDEGAPSDLLKGMIAKGDIEAIASELARVQQEYHCLVDCVKHTDDTLKISMESIAGVDEALGNGADEQLWPPGMTRGQAVARQIEMLQQIEDAIQEKYRQAEAIAFPPHASMLPLLKEARMGGLLDAFKIVREIRRGKE
ncbi:MAG: hypothetical protein WC824_14485 [Bacteroidota bacterium]|jgi:hypothetical protein